MILRRAESRRAAGVIHGTVDQSLGVFDAAPHLKWFECPCHFIQNIPDKISAAQTGGEEDFRGLNNFSGSGFHPGTDIVFHFNINYFSVEDKFSTQSFDLFAQTGGGN